jgi:hypothetical protein
MIEERDRGIGDRFNDEHRQARIAIPTRADVERLAVDETDCTHPNPAGTSRTP